MTVPWVSREKTKESIIPPLTVYKYMVSIVLPAHKDHAGSYGIHLPSLGLSYKTLSISTTPAFCPSAHGVSDKSTFAFHPIHHLPPNNSSIFSIGTLLVSGAITASKTHPTAQTSAQNTNAPYTSRFNSILGVTRTIANWKNQCSAMFVA